MARKTKKSLRTGRSDKIRKQPPVPPRARKPGRSSPELSVANRSAAAGPPTIVGVGASAGGLEAFTQLLHALQEPTGMAIVLVQHLAAKHEVRGLLQDVLQQGSHLEGLELDHSISGLGDRKILLDARRIPGADDGPGSVLLAIETVRATR